MISLRLTFSRIIVLSAKRSVKTVNVNTPSDKFVRELAKTIP